MVSGIIKLTYILLGIYLMIACISGTASFIFALVLSSLVSIGLDLLVAKYAERWLRKN